MAVGEIFKLALLSRVMLVECVNLFYFRQANTSPVGDVRAFLANDFAGTVVAPAGGGIRAMVTSSTLFHTVTVQSIYPYSPAVFPLSLVANNSGTDSVTPFMPACVACCITEYTARGGRSGRGRFYVSNQRAALHTDGLWASTYLTRGDQLMTTINNRYVQASGVALSGFETGIWSRKLAGAAPPFDPTAFAVLSGWRTQLEVRVLSRRVRKIS